MIYKIIGGVQVINAMNNPGATSPEESPPSAFEQDKIYSEYENYFSTLFANAHRGATVLDYLCSLLRVSGASYGHWDPFVEADEALTDFSGLLEREFIAGNQKLSIRLGLLIYCHATEMAAPYEILGNLLRCKQGKHFQWDPFFHLRKRDKKDFTKHILPSPKRKIKFLEEEARSAGEEELIEIIRSFYDDELRNAFYHSDYCITEDEFRIASGVGNSFSLDEVSLKLVKCFAFYNAFFAVYKAAKLAIDTSERKVFKMPEYDVLEVLTDSVDGLYGFKIHHSNGTYSIYERRKDRSHSLNLSVGEKEGISCFVGDLDALENKWKINGKDLE